MYQVQSSFLLRLSLVSGMMYLQDHEPHGKEIVTGLSHSPTPTVIAPGNNHVTPPLLLPPPMVPVLQPFSVNNTVVSKYTCFH